MKILKRGKPPLEKEYTATCSNCDTEFQFSYREVNLSPDQRDPQSYIGCPVCNNYVYQSRFVPIEVS